MSFFARQSYLQTLTNHILASPGMVAWLGGFGTKSNIQKRFERKSRVLRRFEDGLVMPDRPPGAEPFRHRQSDASGTEWHRSADHLMPGVQRHQLWDAPVPHSQPSDSVERIPMQPPRQHYSSIRFGDELDLGKEPESSIQSPSTPSQGHGGLVPPTASQVTNSNLTSFPPTVRYDGLPPISSAAVSPFEVIDPFKDNTITTRPVDYNSPSLESPSSDSLDHGQAKSPHTHLHPRSNSDSDHAESVSLVDHHDGSTAEGSEI